MNVLDCRGLPCPEPVIRCRDWLATVNGAVLEVLVDNPAAVENVSVFLSGRGWTVDSRREGDAVWCLSAVRDEAAASSSAPSSEGQEEGQPEGGEGEGESSAPEGESSDSGEGQEAACGPRSWYAL